jgi:hypothetical protein
MDVATFKDNKEINIFRKTFEENETSSGVQAAGNTKHPQFNPYCNNEGTTLGKISK